MTPRRYDESDVRIRPSRSNPRRSKDRPDYSTAPTAFVTTVDRGRITCLTDSGVLVTAMKARELGKNSVVVGDRIRLSGDVTGADGTLARAVEVMPRKNQLSRTVDDVGAFEKVLVSNIDQMVIVVAAANPEPRHGFIDRCLVVAFDQGITPILVVTKCDLADPADFIETYRDLKFETITSSIPKNSTEKSEAVVRLLGLLDGKVSVLIGHSGVGKSTLFNRLLGTEARATGSVNDATGRGRHTSSSAHAFALANGWLIDTPGVRSFGLEHIDRNRVISSFADLAEAIESCPKNCSHNEPNCGLNRLGGEESHARVESLRRLLNSSMSYSQND